MNNKLNSLFSLGVTLLGLLFSSTPSAMAVNFMWNNTGTTWNGTSSWTNGIAPASNSAATTDTVEFGNMTANFNTVYLASNRTVLGATFDAGANAYTFTTDPLTPLRLAISTSGIANNSSATQTFNLGVDLASGNSTWQSVAGGSLIFNNGIALSTSSGSRTLTVAGAGNFTANQAIVNGGTATAGVVIVTATGTTTFSGNNTYDGLTTMNAAGGTLTLSGNNSGAAGGVTLTTGTLNINNANALGTGLLELGAVTSTAYGSSIINNTSGGALTYLGLSGVKWSGVSPAGIQFGTAASTSANNMDFGTGLVTTSSDRSMNIAGTDVTISMGILTTSGTSASYTYKIDGVGNTLDLDGWRISGATTPTQAVQHKINASANVNIGVIENGTGAGAFANSVSFNNDGVTRLTGNNTYTGTTEFVGSGTNIISGNNSSAVGNVKIAGGTSKKPVVRLDSVNAISSSSSLLGASSTNQLGTLDIRVASDIVLNSFGTATVDGNNMNFTNSSATQRSLTFTNANNYITLSSGATSSKKLDNQSANLNILFNGNIDMGSSTTDAVTFAGAGNFRVNGALTNGGLGVRGLTKTGAGTLTLAGAGNDYNGTTAVAVGTLLLTNSATLTGSTALTVSTSGYTSSSGRTVNATLNLASGSTLLSGSTTTVYSGGNLIVNGTAGGVVLESNGLLGGSGTVGSVNLKSGAFLNPGNSPGTLTALSSTWAAGSTYNWEIDNATGIAGTNWDLFSVTSALDMSALSPTAKMNLVLESLSLANYSTSTSYPWVIAKAASFTGIAAGNQDLTTYFNINSAAFNGGTLADLPNGGFQVVASGVDSNNLRTLSLMAVPEPSMGALLAFGLGGLVLTRLLGRKQS
jgi:autotransporter-associated beta strand protein